MAEHEQQQRIATLTTSTSRFKGRLTRATNAARQMIDFASTAAPNPRIVVALEQHLTTLTDRLRKFQDAADELIALDPTKEDILNEALDEKTMETSEQETKLLGLITEHTQVVEQIQQVPQAERCNPSQPQFKPDTALKPSVLTRDNTPVEFSAWTRAYKAYFKTSHFDLAQIETQQAYFLNCLDPYLQNSMRAKANIDMPIYEADEDGETDYTDDENSQSCMGILHAIFLQRYPLFNRRLDYFRCRPMPGQLYSDFRDKLNRLGEEADLPGLTTEDIKIMMYMATVPKGPLHDKFMLPKEPTLKQLDQMIDEYEMAINKANANHYSDDSLTATSIMQVQPTRSISSKSKSYSPQHPQYHQPNRPGKVILSDMRKKRLCLSCNKPINDHKSGKCWAKSSTCKFCNNLGHIEAACINKKSGRAKRSKSQSRPASPPSITTAFACVNHVSASKDTPRLNVRISPSGSKPFHFNILPDTGATISILARDVTEKYNIKVNRSINERILTANGSPMPCDGLTTMHIYSNGNSAKVKALVTPAMKNDIFLSWHDLQKLKVIPENFPNPPAKLTKVNVSSLERSEDEVKMLISNYPEVFDEEELKPMRGPPMRIHLNASTPVKPSKVLTARQIPRHQEEAAAAFLKKMLDSGVIVPVNDPTDWISPAFFVMKTDGSVRLVTDYTKLNTYVQRPVHPFMSSADILRAIKAGSKCFAKLDARSGYFQIALDKESSYLTTFLLPSGRYRYTRAPMGLSASSDEFCSRTDQALANLPGVLKIVDDILVHAENWTQLYDRLHKVLKKCKEHGITLTKKKVNIGTSMKFAGFIVSDQGVQPDPDKLKAIANFPQPNDVSSLRSFLGLAVQIANFVPDLAHMTTELRSLLKKDKAFVWLPEHQNAFSKVKHLLTSPPIVQFYDPNKDTYLLTDASRTKGLGYALIQYNDKKVLLIECGSRSLTTAESNYATIELECLAIAWAVDKCKYYLAGNPKFQIVTDHKPLIGSFKKPLDSIDNNRLLRFRERLLNYSFEISWTAGKTHQIADALSRAPVFSPPEDEVNAADVKVCFLGIEDPALTELIDIAAADQDYQKIITALKSEKRLASLPSDHPARAFKNFWSELSIYENKILIFRSNRMVIPKSLRKKFLGYLHIAHAGVAKTRKLAQTLYFWPAINADIEALIDRCQLCQERRPKQPSESLQKYEKPTQPMSAVAADLYECKGRDYLILVDRYSGWPFVARLNSTTTSTITKTLEAWFLDWGWPAAMIADGGPQFRTEFKEFCSKNFIDYTPTSAYHPKSNGLAEAGVKRCKDLLDKVDSWTAFQNALLHYRNIPRADMGLMSPAERFLGRRQRRLLPELPQALPEKVKNAPCQGRDLPLLQPGQKV